MEVIIMADITKCVNKNCKVRYKCYRYTAKPSMYQSYSDFNNKKINSKEECEHFYPFNTTKHKYQGCVYALYKGDKFIYEGTKKEISEYTGLSIKTLNYFRTNHYVINRRSKTGKNNRKILIKLTGIDKFANLQ